jgi:hypothetical protein
LPSGRPRPSSLPSALGRTGRGVLLLFVAAVVCATPVPALAQQPGPTGPTLTGSIEGSAVAGGRLTIRLAASEAGGWQNLHEVQVFMLFHAVILDRIVYDQEPNTVVTSGSLPALVGSNDVAAGPFFIVNARDVIIATQGDTMRVTIQARMSQAAPKGAEFSLAAVDDLNRLVRQTRAVQVPADKTGFSWGAVLAAIIAALFAGSFLGGLFVNRRRPPPRPSVYGSVRRGMEQKARS